MALAERKTWSQKVDLDGEEIADALKMTYRAVRHSQNARLEGVTEKAVTLAADLLLFRRACQTASQQPQA